jgi:uncharacterized membrane protein YbaN (DUF454 family)
MRNVPSTLRPLTGITKILLIVGGTLSLAIGIVGAFLPVLPTTPFILLAAICYVRSSQQLYDKLMKSRFANQHVHNVLAGKGIPLSVKIVSLVFSAVMIGYVSMFITESVVVRTLLGLLYLVQLWAMLKWIKTSKREGVPSADSHETVTQTFSRVN